MFISYQSFHAGHDRPVNMLDFRTQGYNGYSVKYSPFFDSRIAVAAAANFGLVGNGRLYILGLTANGIVAEKWYAFFLPFPGVYPVNLASPPGSIPKTRSSTRPGPNRTRTRSSLRPATAA